MIIHYILYLQGVGGLDSLRTNNTKVFPLTLSPEQYFIAIALRVQIVLKII